MSLGDPIIFIISIFNTISTACANQRMPWCTTSPGRLLRNSQHLYHHTTELCDASNTIALASPPTAMKHLKYYREPTHTHTVTHTMQLSSKVCRHCHQSISVHIWFHDYNTSCRLWQNLPARMVHATQVIHCALCERWFDNTAEMSHTQYQEHATAVYYLAPVMAH